MRPKTLPAIAATTATFRAPVTVLTRTALPAAVTALTTVAFPAAALAAAPGVHVDPGSPSQHQYVVPISAARAETSGGKHQHGSQLFGNGITPSSKHSSPTATTRTTPRTPTTPHAASTTAAAATTASAVAHHHKAHRRQAARTRAHVTYALAASGRTPSPPVAQVSSGNGGTGWLPLAGGGALVLLLGGGGGLLLRRRLLRT